MASLQPSWFSSLKIISPAKPNLLPSTYLGMPSSFKPTKVLCAVNPANAESSEPTSPNSEETSSEAQPGPIDPVKLAFSKAKAYKESVKLSTDYKMEQNPAENSNTKANGSDGSGSGQNAVVDGTKEIPLSVKIAMEKAKKYNKNKGVELSDESTSWNDTIQGLQDESRETLVNKIMDNTVGKKGGLSVSKIDFMGLEFADKKQSRRLPPGLVPISDPFPQGDFPEVELIVGDTSKFGPATDPKPEKRKENEPDLYKPRVSTWGVFPRPSNISKTFGGGRNIRPGEALETAEERAAKEARTKELLAAYKKSIGLNIDAKLKSECEEAMKDGDSLMNAGRLKQALPYYEMVMNKLPFKSELYGLAALQWSICLDSLTRSNEARIMYEKLQSHPSVEVSKKARQFMFSFQAMEMMKVTSRSPFSFMKTGYQDYFDAFVENKSNNPLEDDAVQESATNQVLLSILFLLSPIFVVLLFALQKRI